MKLNAFKQFWKGAADKSIGDDMKVVNLLAQKIKAIERNDWKEVERLEREIAAADKEKANKSVTLKKGDLSRKNRETLKTILAGNSSIAKVADVSSVRTHVAKLLEDERLGETKAFEYLKELFNDGEIDRRIYENLMYDFGIKKSSSDEAIIDSSRLSNCCGAPIYSDTDICSKCKEHCEEMGEDKSIDKATAADAQKIQDQIDNLSKDFDKYNDAGDQKAADRVYAEIQKLEKKLEGLQLDKGANASECTRCGGPGHANPMECKYYGSGVGGNEV